MADTRHKDLNWNLGESYTWDAAKVAVLMDVRDELKKLNALLHCHNTMAIPTILRGIQKNTTKRKRTK